MAVAGGPGRRRLILALLLLTAVTLIAAGGRRDDDGPLGAVGRAAHSVVAPVQRVSTGAARSVGDWWSGLTDAGDLRRDKRRLERRIAELEGRERNASQARAEVLELKRLLGLDDVFDVARVNARVIGRNPGNFSTTITIDRGNDRGIVPGMPVVAPDGALVGRVIDSGRRFAVVRLVTDASYAVGVETAGAPGSRSATGTAKGRAGSSELLVEDFEPVGVVKVGNRVETSPLSTSDPPDLALGRVTRIDELGGGIGRNVRVAPYAELSGLDFVAVLLWKPGLGPVVRPTTTTTSTTVAPTTTTTSGG
ncbi:MAG: rod shape-determining protein MreC [Actinomycetota bacterium]